ncbi:MAG: SMI1/KNR4 family protein [Thermoanaerobaculia bacterium]|nr:SMI1/KNR4 family protein [Thermoanaerobaculia bacterium]
MSLIEEQCRNVLVSIDTSGGASAEEITKAEQALGIVFPAGYRKFLERYGAAMGAGYEIAGVFALNDDEPPMWRDIVGATNQIRRVTGSNIASTLLPISSDGASVTYYLDVRDRERSPVVAYAPGVDGKRVAESFEEFVVKLSNGDLEV